MSNSVLRTLTPEGPGWSSNDGLILDVNTTDLGNNDTSYSYFDLGAAGFDLMTLSYIITATTLTIEASDDTDEYGDEATELITGTTDRTFGGAGNWAAENSATVAVGGGDLDVTVTAAGGGAKLAQRYFNKPYDRPNGIGFERNRRYTIAFDITAASGGTVSVRVGNTVVASGLTAGAGQSVVVTVPHGGYLAFTLSAAGSFSIDNVSVKPVAKTWSDLTTALTGGATIVDTGSLTLTEPLPRRRIRIKRLTTNAINALELRLRRSKT